MKSNVKIPKEYAKRKKLIAVPEDEYREFRAVMYPTDEEVRDVRRAEAEIRAGKVVRAKSINEAMRKAQKLGCLDED